MYTIKEASARSGVSVPLLRAWERRYVVVEPTRTRSGYRLYDDAAIERLRAMRALIAGGWSAQQAADRVRATPVEDLSALAGAVDDASTASAQPIDGSAVEGLIARIVDAAGRIDTAALELALDEAFSMTRFEFAAEHVLMPALHGIGEAWERGALSVAAEHAASHAVLRRLAIAYEAADGPIVGRPILVGLGPGARHELGALAFAIGARRAGLPVLYLGPDLPANDWTAAAVGRDARAAVVGVPTGPDVRHANEVLGALRAARPDLLLAVGGSHAARVARIDGVVVLPAGLSAAVTAMRDALPAGA